MMEASREFLIQGNEICEKISGELENLNHASEHHSHLTHSASHCACKIWPFQVFRSFRSCVFKTSSLNDNSVKMWVTSDLFLENIINIRKGKHTFSCNILHHCT